MTRAPASAANTEPAMALPRSTEVLVVGTGPAGSSAAAWCARAGFDTLAVDSAVFPRDKTCGDGLTPRAMSEMGRLGIDGWALSRIQLQGLRLEGFGHTQDIRWPDSSFGRNGGAVPRSILDAKLREVAIDSGANVIDNVSATGVEFTGMAARSSVSGVRFTSGSHTQVVACRWLIVADGVRSPIGKTLGRSWHRETVHAVAARSYIHTPRGDESWITSHLELRDAANTIQPGYGWIFPLGGTEANLGVGALSTARRPATVAVRTLLSHYARQTAAQWAISGEPQSVASALLPMGGAVSGVAGPNWALVGDSAACINPLNGEGIDYGLEGGRLLADLLSELRAGGKHLSTDHGAGASLIRTWPATLSHHYGDSFALARTLAATLTHPATLTVAGPIGMRSNRIMNAAVRCMGNLISESDKDIVARAWRTAGSAQKSLTRRPLFN